MIVSIDSVSKNPEQYFRNVLTSSENLLVSSENGNLIVTREEDWNQLNETLRLLSDHKSLQSLLEGINARKSNSEITKYTLEDVFSGL